MTEYASSSSAFSSAATNWFLPEKEFKRLCMASCQARAADGIPVIRKVAAVGALDYTYAGSSRDSFFITEVLNTAVRAGLPVSPDVKVDPINFREERDFLAEADQYDAVLVCFILGFIRGNPKNGDIRTFGRNAIQRHPRGFTVSPHHTAQEWRERIAQSGAHLVATFGSEAEINSRDLQSKRGMIELIATPRGSISTEQDTAYLARFDYIEALQRQAVSRLDPAIPLAQAIKTKELHGPFDRWVNRCLNQVLPTTQFALD